MSAPPVKKACDACHRRKVRCSGGQPCKNCGHASLQCTYLAIPQKKGPKGSRAKVISEIRDKQNERPPDSASSIPDQETSPFDFNQSPLSPGYMRSPDLLTQQTIETCVTFFFSHLYPTMPIFSRSGLVDLITNQRETNLEVHCMIAALCAFMMAQPGISFQGIPSSIDRNEAGSRHRHANLLLEEVIRVRKNFDYVESPTVLSVQTSFFMFCSYFCMEKQNRMWFYLREASTLAQTLMMHDESSYRSGDPAENMYKRRLYWLLLLTERAYAMERHRPLSLYATIELPMIEEEPQETAALAGFLYLANLIRTIDDDFMALWNKAKSECSGTWLSQLQQQIVDALPPTLSCTENQAADVRVTQHWLRTMVWQLSITNGCLSSASDNISMSFKYPIYIAQDLMRDLYPLSQQSMEVHGIGLIEKLFDIACTLTDVIACVPLDDTSISGEAPSECLNQLLKLISRLRGGSSRYQPLLVAKVSENFPSLTRYQDLPTARRARMQDSQSPQHDGGGSLPTLAPAIIDTSSIQHTNNNTNHNHHLQQQQSTPVTSFPTSSPFTDQQQRELTFDTYSPSLSHGGSDLPLTPMTPSVGMVTSSTSPFIPQQPKPVVQNMSNLTPTLPRSTPHHITGSNVTTNLLPQTLAVQAFPG